MTDLSALRQSAETCFQQGRMMELPPHEVLRLVQAAMRAKEEKKEERG